MGKYIGGSIITKSVSTNGTSLSVWPSKAIIQDPFTELNSYGGAIPLPPYSLEQMVLLTESHPIHGAAIEQKVSDIIAAGPEFVPLDPGQENPDELADLQVWWNSLFEDYTDAETLNIIWKDYETVGWGCMEIARDNNGVARRLYHVPGHTMRSSVDGNKFVQMRNGKMVWFKKWGAAGDIYARTGKPCPPETDPTLKANDMLIFKKPTVRSTWYGIPVYISSLGHITLGVTARDYNILFFENAREPRHVFIVTGLDEDVEEMLDDLEKALVTQHKDPHRNLLLPFVGSANVKIQPLANQMTDQQFGQLMATCDSAILTSHRIPPDRLGVTRTGLLGGSDALITDRIYKDSIVSRGQSLLEDRLNRFVNVEFPKSKDWKLTTASGPLAYQISFEQLDITDEGSDTNITVAQVANNLISLNEGRVRLGYSRVDKFGDMTQSEYLASLQQASMGVQPPLPPSPAGTPVMASRDLPSSAVQEMLLDRIEKWDDLADSLLHDPLYLDRDIAEIEAA